VTSTPPRVRCREITSSDLAAIAVLLAEGFPDHPNGHWARALQRLHGHSPPAGCPRYGYLLEHAGAPVGVVLLIFSPIVLGRETRTRCCVSCWYVRPTFRPQAAMLARHALHRKDVTYVNMTPAPHTRPILEAQGYRLYCSGGFVAAPALNPNVPDARVAVAKPEMPAGNDLSSADVALLVDHAGYGCLSVVVEAAGRRHPFVFLPRRKLGFPYAYLAYCNDQQDFIKLAGPLGRFLLRRGIPLVVLDANGPISGLIGTYSGHAPPKYFKGADQPRLGDWAYSERVMFGV
jgi:hypothetical protein